MSPKLLKKLEQYLAQHESREEWISEEEAAQFLQLKVVSLRNKVYAGMIPAECYAKTVTGNRIYDKRKLILR